MGIDCCSADREKSCCDIGTVEGDQVRRACESVIHSIELLRNLPDTLEDSLLITKYIDVKQAIAELTHAVVDYGGPGDERYERRNASEDTNLDDA